MRIHVYIGHFKKVFVFLALYVDDGLLFAESREVLDEVLDALRSSFEITRGSPSSFAGMEIERDRNKRVIFVHQRRYIERILSRFGMKDARPVCTPADPHFIGVLNNESNSDSVVDCPYREAIGSLIFLVQLTRPDLTYIVNFSSRFLSCPLDEHWRAVKRIFRYLRGTMDFGIKYQGRNDVMLIGYSDADYAGDIVTRRSTTGYIFMISGGAVSWTSQRQSMVSLSTTEAEYVAASAASKELVWLRRLLNDIDCQCDQPTTLFVDSQSAIKLIKNPEFHKRTKHIDILYHFIRERYIRGDLILKYVNTNEQCADFLTKVLCKERLKRLLSMIGVCSNIE